jgi:photosystem II stability/assembly factor-like uncharacterized protein
MSSEPVSSNSNRTFTLDPYDNLTVGSTYLTRVTTGVKDAAGNALSSQYDNSTGFAPADTIAPTVSSVSTTADNQSSVSITDNITVTFSEAMDNTTVTTNTDNTSCYGTLRVTSDNFSSCVQMSSSSPESSDNITFTLDPSGSLTGGTTYKTRVTTAAKDAAGNAMSSQYETSSGFTTADSTEGVYVAVGDSGNILKSTDNGLSWYNASTPLGSGLYAVTFGNNTFVAVGTEGNIVRSTDNGTTWDNATSPTDEDFWGVTLGNNTFVAVGTNGTIVRSTDNGSSFDNETSGTSLDMYGVTYGNNTFVAVGEIGNIRTSSDGSSWTHRTKPQSYNLMGATFGNNTFVAVGYNGSVVRSTDNGTSWDDRTSASGITTNIRGVTFGNNTFVAVGSNGNIVRSTDNGSNWDNATDPTSSTIWGVGFGNNTFVAVGASGNIVRSTDNGSSFDNVTSGTSQSLRGVAFSGNWQLIARQVDSDNFTDGSHELFSSNALSTFLENDNDSSSSTFMSIGNLTPSNYVSDGKYKFKLVWDGMEMASEDIKEVTWTQTSWLTASTTQGFQEIGVSGFNTGAASNTDFVGLALSTSSQCVIDGDGGTVSNKWFNCVGLIDLWNSSMPGPLGKKASSMHLYIWVP